MTLNLADPQNSDIKFKISPFPDGQQQVSIIPDFYGDKTDITIKSRLTNFSDLELLCCAVASIREMFYGKKGIRIFIPYFLGSRSDRKFEEGGNNYLKSVICPIINNLDAESVTVVDPHSDVLEACLNNFEREENHSLVKWALTKINNKYDAQEKTIFISPDAGALKKIYKVAEFVNYKGTIVTCNKSRDINGAITKTEVPHFDITKDAVIIDDICDGGRTFIEIAKIIKQRHEDYDRDLREHNMVPSGKIFLIVTHGIFSKGFNELSRYFDGIYCTNSYSEAGDFCVDFGESRASEFITNKLHQLKVI